MAQPLTDRTRRRTLLGVVGVVFVTAGCLGAPGTSVDDPSAVADKVESRSERLEGFQATISQQLTVGNETRTARATVAFEKDEFLVVAYHTGPNAGHVAVIDDPSARLVTGSRTDAETDTGAVYGAITADLVRDNDVVFEGTDWLDDRLAAVFSVTPPDDAAETRPARRVWIDVERVVPLRIESTWTENDQRVRETIRFENVSLGVPGGMPDADGTPTAGGATA